MLNNQIRLDAREVLLGEYSNVNALTNGEVAAMLTEMLENREGKGERIDPMLIRCRDHAVKFNKIVVPQAELGAREFMKEQGLHEFEIAVLINHCPDTVEMALDIQPSILRIQNQEGRGAEVLEQIVEALEVAVHSGQNTDK